MRELKFRAWQAPKPEHAGDPKYIQEGRMSYDIQKGCPLDECHCSENFQDWLDNSDNIVMQYSGHKDKNGVEIFEGDIVVCPPYPDTFVVKWGKHGSFTLAYGADLSDNMWFHAVSASDYGKNIEVVGNVYENPELLKEAA